MGTAQTDVLTNIQNHIGEFSKGQKLIANYILEYYDKAAFITASKMGKIVGVSRVDGGAFCRGTGLRRISRHAAGLAGDDP